MSNQQGEIVIGGANATGVLGYYGPGGSSSGQAPQISAPGVPVFSEQHGPGVLFSNQDPQEIPHINVPGLPPLRSLGGILQTAEPIVQEDGLPSLVREGQQTVQRIVEDQAKLPLQQPPVAPVIPQQSSPLPAQPSAVQPGPPPYQEQSVPQDVPLMGYAQPHQLSHPIPSYSSIPHSNPFPVPPTSYRFSVPSPLALNAASPYIPSVQGLHENALVVGSMEAPPFATPVCGGRIPTAYEAQPMAPAPVSSTFDHRDGGMWAYGQHPNLIGGYQQPSAPPLSQGGERYATATVAFAAGISHVPEDDALLTRYGITKKEARKSLERILEPMRPKGGDETAFMGPTPEESATLSSRNDAVVFVNELSTRMELPDGGMWRFPEDQLCADGLVRPLPDALTPLRVECLRRLIPPRLATHASMVPGTNVNIFLINGTRLRVPFEQVTITDWTRLLVAELASVPASCDTPESLEDIKLHDYMSVGSAANQLILRLRAADVKQSRPYMSEDRFYWRFMTEEQLITLLDRTRRLCLPALSESVSFEGYLISAVSKVRRENSCYPIDTMNPLSAAMTARGEIMKSFHSNFVEHLTLHVSACRRVAEFARQSSNRTFPKGVGKKRSPDIRRPANGKKRKA